MLLPVYWPGWVFRSIGRQLVRVIVILIFNLISRILQINLIKSLAWTFHIMRDFPVEKLKERVVNIRTLFIQTARWTSRDVCVCVLFNVCFPPLNSLTLDNLKVALAYPLKKDFSSVALLEVIRKKNFNDFGFFLPK